MKKYNYTITQIRFYPSQEKKSETLDKAEGFIEARDVTDASFKALADVEKVMGRKIAFTNNIHVEEIKASEPVADPYAPFQPKGWRTEDVNNALAYMIGAEDWDGCYQNIPFVYVAECSTNDFYQWSHVLEREDPYWNRLGVSPRIVVLDNGIFSPVKSPWEGWYVAGHSVLGEKACICAGTDKPGCPWCAPDPGVLQTVRVYFGEETIEVLLMPDNEYADSFLENFTRMHWVSAYADECESIHSENGFLRLPPMAGPGEDWYSVAPEWPSELDDLAEEIILEIEQENDATLTQLVNRLVDEPNDACIKRLAECLALQYTGHGVGVADWAHEYNVPHTYDNPCIKVPYGSDDRARMYVCDWLDEQNYT